MTVTKSGAYALNSKEIENLKSGFRVMQELQFKIGVAIHGQDDWRINEDGEETFYALLEANVESLLDMILRNQKSCRHKKT